MSMSCSSMGCMSPTTGQCQMNPADCQRAAANNNVNGNNSGFQSLLAGANGVSGNNNVGSNSLDPGLIALFASLLSSLLSGDQSRNPLSALLSGNTQGK